MNSTLERRLNIVHVAVARAGTSRPTGWLDDKIVDPSPEEAAPDGPMPPPPKRRALDPEAARRMAADLEGYDSKIVGGRLR